MTKKTYLTRTWGGVEMTLSIPLLISSITVILLASCSSKLDLEVADSEGTCTTDCPQITTLNPPAAQGGDQVTMEGENFYPGMTITIDGQVITPDVISATEASFTMPDGSPGSKAVLVTGNSDDSAFTAYQVADDGVPLFSASADLICQGTQFYNAAGELTSGTANCSVAPSDCSADGEIGCLTTAGFPSANATGLATKIVSGNTVAGVAGTTTLPTVNNVSNGIQYGADGTEFTGTGAGPSVCTSDGQTSCLTDASFPAADASLAVAGNIKSGVTIAGTAGDYPSSTYPLPSASGTADLDNSTFNAQVKSASAFEYWSSDGSYHSGAGDANISAANYRDTVSIFGVSGSIADCSADGSTGCYTVASYPSVDTTAINEWDIKTGKTVGGISGSVKTNCRNGANLSVFDRATANGTVDWFDTIDQFNSNATALPTDQPSDWTSANLCGKELWSDITADGTCDSAGDDCLMKDNVTGLTWSEGGAAHNSDSTDTTDNWDNAIAHCQGLNTEDSGAGYGGITTWRLPTHLELLDAYSHGIRHLGNNDGVAWTPGDSKENNDFFIEDVDRTFWSATTVSTDSNQAWKVEFHFAYVFGDAKNNNNRIICVSP